MLPVRTAAGRAVVARAAKIFQVARAVFEEDPRAFGLRASAVRVEHLETRLPVPPAAARRALARAKSQPPRTRQSIEYYWSGRRVLDGHKQIRLIKVETDTKGNVLRSAVVHSS